MNLKDAMQLAGQCLLAWLDPEKEFMPAGGVEVCHDVGRWWDAALRLEDAIGFVTPAELERLVQEEVPHGRSYSLKWRGYEIVGVDPREGMVPFYPAMAEER